MMSPAGQSQTSSSLQLQAAAPAGYTSATFWYRQGTTAPFQNVPGASGIPVTSNSAGVQTAAVTWNVTQTLPDDGPVQIQAVFTGSGSVTTPAVTVTLNRVGTGADFGTTSAGPATVGLQSGNAAITATDVNIASYGSALTVTRTFNSVAPQVSSIFGPGWTTSLTGGTTTAWTQLTSSSSYAVLQDAAGDNDAFTKGTVNGSTVTWTPQGTAVTSGLTLTQNTSSNTFTLTDSSGTVTTFTQSPTAGKYLPQTVTPAGTAGSTGIVYDGTSSNASYGDPLLMVAPTRPAPSRQPPPAPTRHRAPPGPPGAAAWHSPTTPAATSRRSASTTATTPAPSTLSRLPATATTAPGSSPGSGTRGWLSRWSPATPTTRPPPIPTTGASPRSPRRSSPAPARSPRGPSPTAPRAAPPPTASC